MFVASRRIGLFERYRVPYTIDPSTAHDKVIRIARADGRGAELLSVRAALDAPARPFVLDGAFLRRTGGRYGDRGSCRPLEP